MTCGCLIIGQHLYKNGITEFCTVTGGYTIQGLYLYIQ